MEYFVSYYDYYQPEAYLPSTDTFIEKDLSINAEIEKLRLRTVATLLSGRRDVIVVSSVSCLYGAGNPADFHATAINIRVGQVVSYKHFLYKLVEALYTRTERDLEPATFRVNGDTVDIMAAFGEFGSQCFRVMFYDNEVEAIQTIDPATGQRIHSLDNLTLYPRSLFVTTKERINCAVQQIYGSGQADRILRACRTHDGGAAHQTARGIRRRDDQGAGVLPRHRKLLTLFRRPRPRARAPSA